MRALTPAVRSASTWRGPIAPRFATPLLLCGALDTVAAVLLLLDIPREATLARLAAAACHLVGVLVLASWPTPHASRRGLCAAAALVVPWLGAVVAAAVLATRGRGSLSMRRDVPMLLKPAFSAEAARRLGETLSPCDALLQDDEELRRIALSALSRRADREGIAVLRWAASGRDPDLALLAALALDEIGERAERRRPGPVENAHA